MMMVQMIVVHRMAEVKGRNDVVFIRSLFRLMSIVLVFAAKLLQICEMHNRYMQLHTLSGYVLFDYQ